MVPEIKRASENIVRFVTDIIGQTIREFSVWEVGTKDPSVGECCKSYGFIGIQPGGNGAVVKGEVMVPRTYSVPDTGSDKRKDGLDDETTSSGPSLASKAESSGTCESVSANIGMDNVGGTLADVGSDKIMWISERLSRIDRCITDIEVFLSQAMGLLSDIRRGAGVIQDIVRSTENADTRAKLVQDWQQVDSKRTAIISGGDKPE